MYRMVTDLLESIEELLEAKKFKDIIDALGEIEYDLISPGERAYYDLLSIEANLQLGNFDVEARLESVLAYYRESHDNKKFAWAKHLHGRMLMVQGKHLEAREILVESYAMYKRCKLLLPQARVLNQLGQLSFQLGEIDTATQYIIKCITTYGDLQDRVRGLIVSSNLSAVYAYAGHLTKALENYSNITPHVHLLDARNIATVYIQNSVPLALRGNIEAAVKTIDKAQPYLKDFAYEQGSYLVFRGWIYFLDGQLTEARDYQLKAQRLAQKIAPNSALMSQIKRQLAETELGLNDINNAQNLTEEALAIATKINERLEMAGCYRNLGKLESHRGNPDRSRKWFRKAMDLCAEIKARYALALTQYEAASSGAFQEGERQALLYLARDYFRSEKVEGYVTEINMELRGVPTSPRQVPARDGGQSLKIVTANDEMKRLISMSEHIAASDMSVLLTGATGTGKDLFARYIHHFSGRSGKFVSINAAAIPDSMVESELFGHRRGAFTNADRDKVGLIEVAHNGTLYLNEIADSSKELQAKLLDVLETHKVRRLGETKERRVAFRLIAATNHDLNRLINDGTFRIDLYHRIGEVPMTLPLLRDRLEDIQELLTHFLSMAGVTIDEGCPEYERLVKTLSRREWPGNVRQLEAEAKRLALLSGGHVSRMLKFATRRKNSERDELFGLLQQTGWNRREAARKLGVSDTTIRRKIKKYGITKN